MKSKMERDAFDEKSEPLRDLKVKESRIYFIADGEM